MGMSDAAVLLVGHLDGAVHLADIHSIAAEPQHITSLLLLD